MKISGYAEAAWQSNSSSPGSRSETEAGTERQGQWIRIFVPPLDTYLFTPSLHTTHVYHHITPEYR